jgi:hypothetical protein
MITLPASQDAAALVDWLETSLLTQEIDRISDTAITNAFSDADLGDESDALLANMLQAVGTRATVVGAANYPVERQGLGFSRRGAWGDFLPYCFMLFVSLNQNYRELAFRGGTASKPAELFEKLASTALEKYLQCSVLRIGAPRRKPVPPGFPAAIAYLAKELGERVGHGDLERQTSGDDGVDLVGWRSFGDARASQAIILAQCAIGTDWRDKRDEVSLEMWRRHIDWHSAPLKGFAVPFHHQEGNPWRETATRAGIILDRLRIARLVDAAALPPTERRQMVAWCQTRLGEIAQLNLE